MNQYKNWIFSDQTRWMNSNDLNQSVCKIWHPCDCFECKTCSSRYGFFLLDSTTLYIPVPYYHCKTYISVFGFFPLHSTMLHTPPLLITILRPVSSYVAHLPWRWQLHHVLKYWKNFSIWHNDKPKSWKYTRRGCEILRIRGPICFVVLRSG